MSLLWNKTKYDKLQQLVVGTTHGKVFAEETLQGSIVGEIKYPHTSNPFDLDMFAQIELEAKKLNAGSILIVDPRPIVLEALFNWVVTDHEFFFGLSDGDTVRVFYAQLRHKLKEAQVFINIDPLQQRIDDLIRFSTFPLSASDLNLVTPAILDLEKATFLAGATNMNGGWLNPSAIAKQREHWSACMDWPMAWKWLNAFNLQT